MVGAQRAGCSGAGACLNDFVGGFGDGVRNFIPDTVNGLKSTLANDADCLTLSSKCDLQAIIDPTTMITRPAGRVVGDVANGNYKDLGYVAGNTTTGLVLSYVAGEALGAAGRAFKVEPIYDGTPLGPEAPAGGPKVVGGESAEASFGRQMHGQFDQLLKGLAKDDPGSWKSALTKGADRPDGFFNGDPIELKPNTPSGLSAGLSQLKRYMGAFGRSQSYLYVYDAAGNIILLEIVTP